MLKICFTLTLMLPAVLCICKNLLVVPDLKIKDMEGMWYCQYTLKTSTPESTKCQRTFFYVKPDGKGLELTESTLTLGETTKGQSFYASGKRTGSDGKFTLSGKLKGTTYQFQYTVVATDYKNYLITHMCIQGAESAWIMTREPDGINSAAMGSVKEALKKNQLSLSNFQSTPQTNCA